MYTQLMIEEVKSHLDHLINQDNVDPNNRSQSLIAVRRMIRTLSLQHRQEMEQLRSAVYERRAGRMNGSLAEAS